MSRDFPLAATRVRFAWVVVFGAAVEGACGPAVRDVSDDAPGTTSASESGSEVGDTQTVGGPNDSTGAETQGDGTCPEGEFCFDLIGGPANRGLALPCIPVDLDDDGSVELAITARTAGEDGLPAWVLMIMGWNAGPTFLESDEAISLARAARPVASGGWELIETGIERKDLVDGEFVASFPEPVHNVPLMPFEHVQPPLFAAIDVDGDNVDEAIVSDESLMDQNSGAWLLFAVRREVVEDDPEDIGWYPIGPALPVRSRRSYFATAVADLTADGRPELVITDDSGAPPGDYPSSQVPYDPAMHFVTVLEPMGDAGFIELWRASSAVVADWIVLDDLDGDGVLDLILEGSSAVAIARGLGDGSFDTPFAIALAGYDFGFSDEHQHGATGVSTGDFDGDGRSEIAVVVKTHATRTRDVVIISDALGEPVAEIVVTDVARDRTCSFDVDANGRADLLFVSDEPGVSGLSVLMSLGSLP